eukprot:3978098-Lingulodinium_polyedra.AAC.1
MPKQVPWEQLGEAIRLDSRHDLARVPPLLDGFVDFCWRHLLHEHNSYVACRRQEPGGGKYVGTFRCISHVGCFKDRKTPFEYQARLSN